MSRERLWFFAAVALVFCQNVAVATEEEPLIDQDRRITEADFPRGSYNPDSFGVLPRLRNPLVLDFLKLSDKQQNAVNEIQKEWLREFRRYVDLPRENQQSRFQKLREAVETYEKRAIEILDDQQSGQLQRLTLIDAFPPRLLRYILRNERIQKDLRLSKEQEAEIDALYVEYLKSGDKFLLLNGDILNLSPRIKAAGRLKPLRTEFDVKAQKLTEQIFSNAQGRRLAQIQLQFALLLEGPRVFVRDDLARTLMLTEDQREKIAALDKEFSAAPGRERIRRVQKAYRLLDENQQKKFHEQIGKVIYPGVKLGN